MTGTLEPDFLSSTLAALLSLVLMLGFYLPRTPADRRAVLGVALIAFLSKAALVPIYFELLKGWGTFGFTFLDGMKYHRAAFEMAYEVRTGLPHTSFGWGFRDPGYNYLSTGLFLIFGPNPLAPRFINVAFSCMSLLYVYRTARMLFDDERIARISILLLAFLPFSVLIVIAQRKDAVVQFLAAFLLFHSLRMLRLESGWQRELMWVASGLVGMYWMRSGFVFPFMAVVALSLVARRGSLRGFLLASVLVGLFLGSQALAPDDANLNLASGIERLEGKVTKSAGLSEVGGLARRARVSSMGEIYKLPAAAALVMLLPFPPRLDLSYKPSLLFSWANLPWILLLPLVVLGGVITLRSRERSLRMPLVLFPLLFSLLLGLTSIGIARYRETMMPALVILAAVGMRSPSRWTVLLPSYVLIAALGAAVILFRMD